jgi:anti-sigma regulatory factor (Ser/Thr protein kinase)
LPEKTTCRLALALEECSSNIVNHALRRDAQKTFHVTFDCFDDAFVIELRDRGPAFDPTMQDSRRQPLDDELPGGWGLHLIRRFIDEIHYERRDGENVLRLTKRLTEAEPPSSPTGTEQ